MPKVPNVTNNMSIRNAIQSAAERFEDAGIGDSRLEAEVLIAYVMGSSRGTLLANQDEHLPIENQQRLNECIARRLNREPIACITGHKEFFGLDFIVTPDTLIPRPETELLVEQVLQIVKSKSDCRWIADIGTGCGAIAVALAVHLPGVKVLATDISPAALEVAKQNAKRAGVSDRIQFVCGDLLDPLNGIFDIIVANLPYVSDEEMKELPRDVRQYEPHVALAGGPQGLDFIDRLLFQAGDRVNPGGSILLEIGYKQGRTVRELANRYLPQADVEVMQDLGGNDRVAVISRQP